MGVETLRAADWLTLLMMGAISALPVLFGVCGIVLWIGDKRRKANPHMMGNDEYVRHNEKRFNASPSKRAVGNDSTGMR
jgi:hypothetical protein